MVLVTAWYVTATLKYIALETTNKLFGQNEILLEISRKIITNIVIIIKIWLSSIQIKVYTYQMVKLQIKENDNSNPNK
jgi:hypothetical protein